MVKIAGSRFLPVKRPKTTKEFREIDLTPTRKGIIYCGRCRYWQPPAAYGSAGLCGLRCRATKSRHFCKKARER